LTAIRHLHRSNVAAAPADRDERLVGAFTTCAITIKEERDALKVRAEKLSLPRGKVTTENRHGRKSSLRHFHTIEEALYNHCLLVLGSDRGEMIDEVGFIKAFVVTRKQIPRFALVKRPGSITHQDIVMIEERKHEPSLVPTCQGNGKAKALGRVTGNAARRSVCIRLLMVEIFEREAEWRVNDLVVF
jgi:hypothetical protein